MKYNNICEGTFINRPNRFIAKVMIDGKEEICHVKNTGRCKELLIEGAKVFLELSDNPSRKTRYDLISVIKEGKIINIDSQAPNRIAAEYLPTLFGKGSVIYCEKEYCNSRFDFYIEDGDRRIFLEVKGVTLENNCVASFPDAPTQRGTKHVRELIKAKQNGYEAYILFVIQMNGISYLVPNDITDTHFGDALREAEKQGVNIFAIDTIVTRDSITANEKVRVVL